MTRALSEQVVVLTGASSGVGRETALQLAERGATVVAAARNTEALETLAAEVERLGGTIRTVPTDVSKWEQVDALARTAVEAFGGIDTWVNCAAVSLYGRVADLEVAEIDRVLDVILRGEIYGMKAALGVMQPADTGTIINVASALGVRSVPLQSAYCAAKHGVRGFAQALRMELEHDRVPVAVCTLLPSSINTPLFTHARRPLRRVLHRPLRGAPRPRAARPRPLGRTARPDRPGGPVGRALPRARTDRLDGTVSERRERKEQQQAEHPTVLARLLGYGTTSTITIQETRMSSPTTTGIIAGAAGSAALNIATYVDMAVRGRGSSPTPAKAAGKVTQELGVDLGDEDTAKNRKQGLGALLGYVNGVGVGAAYGLLRSKVDVSSPLAAIGLGAAVMVATDAAHVGMGLTDPRKWSAKSWIMDIGPHLAYGLAAAAVFDYIED